MTRILFGNYLNNFCTSKKGNMKVNSFEIKMNNRIISDDLDIAKLCLMIISLISHQNLKSRYNHPSFHFFKLLLIQALIKATGLDSIGPKLLKIGPNISTTSITYIINKSIETGIFPGTWKMQ